MIGYDRAVITVTIRSDLTRQLIRTQLARAFSSSWNESGAAIIVAIRLNSTQSGPVEFSRIGFDRIGR